MTFWDWALAAYARPGVEAACLALQDDHDQNVPLLLWAAWCAAERHALDAASGAEIARDWERRIGAPVRQVRRALKTPMPGIEDAARLSLREQVKAVELAGERTLMTALEALHKGQAPASVIDALAQVSEAWGQAAPDAALERLARALTSW